MKIVSRILLFSLILLPYIHQAQQVPPIEVPDEIEFAGMKLKIARGGKDLLEKDIKLLSKNGKYFQTKVDRANIYFPLIEKVFQEESFPEDFKYLALQESSLIADAVSKSNAVGYWQFKKESAVEVGLRVDGEVDERMNIVSSSRGAVRYLKRNNQTFDNWVYALLSYNLGLGGAKQVIDASNIGKNAMVIDENIHWYVIRFLAHKLLYQHAVGNAVRMDTVLVEYINGSGKTLQDITMEYKLDLEKVKFYNKWLKTDVVPTDKIYPVVLSVPTSQAAAFIKTTPTTDIATTKSEKSKKEKFPSVDAINKHTLYKTAYTLIINRVRAIMARNGDNIVKLSAQGEISKDEFLKFNEMKSFEDIIPGKIYYLEHKKNKAVVLFHTVQYNESIWDIAQNYAIKIETIRDKNRMDENEAVEVGRVLWLRSKRPKNKPVEYKSVPEPPLPVKKMEIEPTPTLVPVDTLPKEENTSAIFPPVKLPVSVPDTYITTYHEVVTGETLFGIARQYKVPTDSILTWNGLQGYGIKIGQRLLVEKRLKQTVVAPTAEADVWHLIQTGDTAYKLSKQYGVTIAQLQEWNERPDLNLRVGEKIIVKKNTLKP